MAMAVRRRLAIPMPAVAGQVVRGVNSPNMQLFSHQRSPLHRGPVVLEAHQTHSARMATIQHLGRIGKQPRVLLAHLSRQAGLPQRVQRMVEPEEAVAVRVVQEQQPHHLLGEVRVVAVVVVQKLTFQCKVMVETGPQPDQILGARH